MTISNFGADALPWKSALSKSGRVRALSAITDQNAYRIVETYPGPAALINGESQEIVTNASGAVLKTAFNAASGGGFRQCVAHVRAATTAELLRLRIAVDGKDKILEVSILPWSAAEVLVLGRDCGAETAIKTALVTSRQLYKDLVECSSDFAWEVDTQGCFRFVSLSGALGYRARDLEGRKVNDLVSHFSDAAAINPFTARQACGDVELWMRHNSGKLICVTANAVPVYDQDNKWIGARGVCRDISEMRTQAQALNQARQREALSQRMVGLIRNEITPEKMLAKAADCVAMNFAALSVWILRLDDDEQIRIAATESLIPIDAGEDDVLPPDLLAKVTQALQQVDNDIDSASDVPVHVSQLDDGHLMVAPCVHLRKIKGAIVVLKEKDESYKLEVDLQILADVAAPVAVALTQAEIQRRLLQLSQTDELTGLLNRRAFTALLEQRIAYMARTGRTGALLYFDLDNFKVVNDCHGHGAGDKVLQILSSVLRTGQRAGDHAARLGGDEFVMWLEETDVAGAKAKAETVLENFLERIDAFQNAETPLGLSIGISLLHGNSERHVDSLISDADSAMYKAKRAGKQRISILDENGVTVTGGHAE